MTNPHNECQKDAHILVLTTRRRAIVIIDCTEQQVIYARYCAANVPAIKRVQQHACTKH